MIKTCKGCKKKDEKRKMIVNKKYCLCIECFIKYLKRAEKEEKMEQTQIKL